jgi:hypothetical protein
MGERLRADAGLAEKMVAHFGGESEVLSRLLGKKLVRHGPTRGR